MREKEEFRVGFARRLRELRLHLGYETAASFARAIGCTPTQIRYYERHGISCSGALKRLVKAIETSGHGKVRYDWLLDSRPDLMFWPGTTPTVPPVRAEGNVLHVNFVRRAGGGHDTA